ncbi:C-type lectin 10 [Operophtera brumata]|uniref:C-type lectin 10 n=1 Tax=Operophtera brumata TaxID=104452 RepID=A0A0L7LF02_OPEBR|nr:C-type lectin 10 [Operophtera brumata]
MYSQLRSNRKGGDAQQRELEFFRNEYKYIESSESFYKIHTLHKSWKDAKKACALEGASLFYPKDQREADEIVKVLIETTSFPWVFIGVSDVMSKGVYDTIDGVSITRVFNNWAPGEPNGGYSQNCAILRRDGKLFDENCASIYPFVCKKSIHDIHWNSDCNMPNMDYELDAALGKCYKFHLNPLSWSDAYGACSAEQSYLAVINSQLEADHLVNRTARAPKDNVEGDYLRGAEHRGYSNWGYTQPDGKGEEKCGSMFYTGQLNDIGCHRRMFFICEHDIDAMNQVIDPRTSKIF